MHPTPHEGMLAPTAPHLLVQKHVAQVADAAAQRVRRGRLARAARPQRLQCGRQACAGLEVVTGFQLVPNGVRVPELQMGEERGMAAGGLEAAWSWPPAFSWPAPCVRPSCVRP